MTRLLLLMLTGGITAAGITDAFSNTTVPRLGEAVPETSASGYRNISYRGSYLGGRWVGRSARLESSVLSFGYSSYSSTGYSGYGGGGYSGSGGWSGK